MAGHRVLSTVPCALQWGRLFLHPVYNSLHLLTPHPSAHPTLLPAWQSQVCSLCPWVCFCFIDKFISVVVEIPHTRDVIQCFSDLLRSAWSPLGPLLLLQMAFFLLFSAWAVFHCVYVSHLLYSFICGWTFKLLPSLGCCECCCYEHKGECIFFNYSFVWVYARSGIAGSCILSAFSFWGTSRLFSIVAAPTYVPPTM